MKSAMPVIILALVFLPCIMSTLPPSFPDTGVIRWNGTRKEVWWYEGDFPVYPLSGEVSVDSKGNYMKKWIEKLKPLNFEIIIPNGAHYTKYMGNNNVKHCRQFTVDYAGRLSTIWKRKSSHFLEQEKRDMTNPNIINQIWKSDQQGFKLGDDKSKGGWYMEYDEVKKHAVPVKFITMSEDGEAEFKQYTVIDYVYRPLKSEGEEIFRLADYCTEEIPRYECDYKK